MSIDVQKEAIAAALSTIEGITGYSGRPDALNPGDMFVRWGGWVRADGDAFLATWSATLVLPQGSEQDADAEAYRVADLIADALQPFMYVTEFAPTSIPTAGSARGMFALTVTGRSE
jgi:hypothetical protein